MARKIFGIDVPKPEEAATSPAPKQAIGSVSGLRAGLRELSANSIRDLDPSMISPDGPQDRITLEDGSLAQLAENIRTHGQQVPILVRPIEGDPGHFRVVYGRRRLAAIRMIGGPVKAIVRTLNDEQAVLAQGQENSMRLDPSFIEKALFLMALEAEGYASSVIEDAIGVDRKLASKYRRVVNRIPDDVIRPIGAAHEIGRPRWEKLADLVETVGSGALDIIRPAIEGVADSNDRFLAAFSALQGATKPPKPQQENRVTKTVTVEDGVVVGSVTQTKSGTMLEVSASAQADFSQWLAIQGADALRELYARWSKEQEEGA